MDGVHVITGTHNKLTQSQFPWSQKQYKLPKGSVSLMYWAWPMALCQPPIISRCTSMRLKVRYMYMMLWSTCMLACFWLKCTLTFPQWNMLHFGCFGDGRVLTCALTQISCPSTSEQINILWKHEGTLTHSIYFVLFVDPLTNHFWRAGVHVADDCIQSSWKMDKAWPLFSRVDAQQN